MSAQTMSGLMLMAPMVALIIVAVAFFFGEVRKDWTRKR